LIPMKKDFLENMYAEAFDGIYCRVVITADDQETVRQAAEDATATPSIVIGRVEGGVEGLLNQKETPDKRLGAILQFWGAPDPKKPLSDGLKKFEIELSYRIRQDILVKPFTAVFDALPKPEGKIDMMERVGHCGDGYEWVDKRYGREVIVVPIMVADFMIERQIGYKHGVMGANIWLMCKTKEALKEAGNRALTAIHEINGVITPFDICSAGSKTETSFPWIGPTTNHEYCPSLKSRLSGTSRVPEGVNYIPEIVINGPSIQAVRKAMKAGIQAASTVKNVAGISAGNYGGKLGQHKIWLRELFK
jgi:formylmethanofuran--tetrahydromethanopterin N-formyltransferase